MPEAPLFPISRVHIELMTDDIGIFQHAIGSRPDPAHGYCVDDVARSLQVDLLHGRELGWDAVAPSAWRSLRFLEDAFDPPTGLFRNFRSADGAWLEGRASEDSQGRAMLALGETVSTAGDRQMIDRASRSFMRALPTAQGVAALRAQSSVLLGCQAALPILADRPTMLAHRSIAQRLHSAFDRVAGSAWPWPEARLTYENALPVRALLQAGIRLESAPMIQTSLNVLDWLITVQLTPAGHLSPVGNTWWRANGTKPQFDQQPIEATAMLLASEDAYRHTHDIKYREAMERAYGWFLGRNDLGLDVADAERGASFDGLTPTGVNRNQGAESTLMWSMALEHIRELRATEDRRPRDEGATPIGLNA
jgi:hypothetical protein